MSRLLARAVPFLVVSVLVQAHVGSPDIYLEGYAGPYRLFVTVRPPSVIPGVARLEIRAETPGVREIRAVPVPMRGPGARFAPIPDKLAVSPQDAQFFTGSLWMMAPGSWQVRITVEGSQGEGILAVPVPSAALMTKKMQHNLGAFLFLLMIFLIAGAVAMVGASVREAKLPIGMAPGPDNKRKARVAMSIAFLILIGTAWSGSLWWDNDATSYNNCVYKPLQMKPTLNGSGVLTLTMSDPGWLKPRANSFRQPFFVRKIDDLVPDHDHLMHLYAIRQPGLDAVYHLHPELIATAVFRLRLPTMQPGTYQLYADIVHANGFPETMVAAVEIPALAGRALVGDDAAGTAAPWDRAPSSNIFTLPDGYRMEWLRGTEALHAKQPALVRFRLLDPDGRAPRDMALYMEMLGHAAFVKTDGTVFAHVHPTGSVSMAAFMMAQQQAGTPETAMDMPGMNMPGMNMPERALPNEVSFPYGFPTPGKYRIFVQMKHGGTIETGIFDADVN